MSPVTIAQINTALHNTLSTISGLALSQDYDDLTESLNEYPVMQVYFVSKDNTIASDTSKNTFGSGATGPPIRQTTITFHVDLHVTPRNFINQIFEQTYPLIDAIDLVFEQQYNTPFFGLDGIKAYRYRCEFVNFTYGNVETNGVRWFIEVDVF